MGVFDKLQSYSAKQGLANVTDEKSEYSVFNLSKPEELFFERIHNDGYAMYNIIYSLKDEFSNSGLKPKLSEDKYNWLDDEDKSKYTKSFEYTELHDVLSVDGNQVVNAIAGSGKALKNGTKVLSENGFVNIEDVKVGDLVYSEDGNLYPVVGVYPQGFKDAYEVKFSDGNSIICNDEHLWTVQTDSQRTMELKGDSGYFWETKSLKDIILSHPLRTRSGKNNCYIPMQSPVNFISDTKLKLNPYLLGLLLGNGNLSSENSVMFSSSDDSVLSSLENILAEDFPELSLNYSVGCDYRLALKQTGRDKDGNYITNPLKNVLAELNLLGTHSNTKFIPKEYLVASVEDRFNLLAGLLDTDGYWATSYYEYTTVSEKLRDDIVFLVESLGLTVTVHKKRGKYINKVTGEEIICKLSYRLNIKPSSANPRLHKCNRINKQFKKTQGYCRRQIKEIIKLNKQFEMTCIEIDSPSHLYLTEHFIPTHNTTFLIFKIMHDIITGEVCRQQSISNGNSVSIINKMWICTFLRSGAEELQKELVSKQYKYGYMDTSNQISFSTLDAEFKRCLNAMGVVTNIGDTNTLNRLFKKAVDSCGITRGGATLGVEDYGIINGVVTYNRGRLDNKKYTHPNCSDYSLTPNMIDLLIKQYSALKTQENVMDFEDITELLYKYLYITPNKNVQDFVANRYNYIYIDEFQDTSQMQYAIIKFYARGKLWLNRDGEEHTDSPLYTGEDTIGKIVVVGDPSQTIYSFKGSDSQIIVHDFDDDFRPTISALSYNWRCPKNILEPIVNSIHKNKDSASQKILTLKEGGILDAYIFGTMQSMVTQLKKDLEVDMKEGNSVAILCRTNFDGMIPAFILESEKKFNFSISGTNMTLSSALPKKILGVSSLIIERSSKTVENSLKMFAGLRGSWEVKLLMDTLRNNSLSIWTIDENDLNHSAPSLYDFIIEAKNILYDNGNKTTKSELMCLDFMYNYLRFHVFGGNSTYAESARAYIDTILYVLNNKNFNSVYDFIEEIDFLDDKLHARIKKQNLPIQIATVHEFKGKECDSVYVWNDTMGIFPSSKCDLRNVEQVEEERRVHYIACTRAKKREHIYCLQGKVGMFLDEMNLNIMNPIPQTVVLPKNNNTLEFDEDEDGNATLSNTFINDANNNLDSVNQAFVSIAEE